MIPSSFSNWDILFGVSFCPILCWVRTIARAPGTNSAQAPFVRAKRDHGLYERLIDRDIGDIPNYLMVRKLYFFTITGIFGSPKPRLLPLDRNSHKSHVRCLSLN